MKLIRDSLSLIKSTAFTLAAFTMVLSPVAQGAQAKTAATAQAKAKLQTKPGEYNFNVNKKSIQEYLKYSGLNRKNLTAGEFYSKMRPFYPKTLRGHMDQWIQMNRNEIMPEVEASTFKDSEGKERIRLLITKDGLTVTASYNPDNNAKFIKVNNVYLTKDDIKFHEQAIRKIVLGDKGIKNAVLKAPSKRRLKQSIALSYEEFSRLKPRQRAEYMVRLRYVMEDAHQVLEKFHGPQAAHQMKQDFFVQWLMLGENAEAKGTKTIRGAKPGDACITNGYLIKYGNDSSCGGSGPGLKALKEEMEKFGGGKCTNGTISCNPLVYGYQASGAAICVKRGKNQEIQTGTSQSCPNQSQLRKGTSFEAEDKKRIIESYLKSNGATDEEKKLNLVFDNEGRISKAQFDLIKGHLDKLNQYVDQAIQSCAVEPLSSIRKARNEQETACTALALRKIEVLSYPETPIAPIVVPVKDCSVEKPGSTLENGECVCRPGDVVGTITEDNVERPACVPSEKIVEKETPPECSKDEERDKETGECVAAGFPTWAKWLIGAAIFGAVATGIYFLFKDDDDDHQPPPPPPDPCPPAPLICLPAGGPPAVTPAAPPPIQPVPPTTAPAGPPDPLPTPAVTPFVEPTSGTSTSTSSGVR